MFFKKLFLCSLLVLTESDKFPTIKGHYEKRGLDISTSSSVKIEEDGYKVFYEIYTNTRDKICLSWPIAQMVYDNNEPLMSYGSKSIDVKYPVATKIATIFLGANLADPINGVECYVDKSSLKLSAQTIQTKISSYNELGESLNLVVTSSIVPQTNIANLEFEIEGDGNLLVEKIDGMDYKKNDNSEPWSIVTVLNIDSIFESSKHSNQIIEFLVSNRNDRKYQLCKKMYDNSDSKLMFSSQFQRYQVKNIAVCLSSKNTNRNIAFLAKAFVAK